MIRGAYVAKLDLDQSHLAGVRDKILAQTAALRITPAEIDVYHLAGGSVVRNGKRIASVGAGALARRFAHYVLFWFAIAARREPLDFLYMRHQGSSPLLLWALSRLRSRNPGMLVIAELPSWPYGTPTSVRGRILSIIDSLSNGSLHSQVDRILTFSRAPRIFGIPTITTDNGVDVARHPLLPERHFSGSLRLLGLANLSFWHGYDRVIQGISRYYAGGGSADIHFDVVGTGAELDRLRHLATECHVEDRVHFHGLRRGHELDAIIATADIGVSSIGMHRLRVETSNLKSREFCARGLPFVIAYDDQDFPATFPYAFRAQADDTPLDIDSIIQFAGSLPPCRKTRGEMRAYAERHLGWDVKMQPVIALLRRRPCRSA